MINAEFLAICTDQQINFGVAWLEAKANPADSWVIPYNNMLFKWNIDHEFEPCTIPNDIMPIAFANGISLQSDHVGNGIWFADDTMDITVGNTNPLRAICEVYILMSVNK